MRDRQREAVKAFCQSHPVTVTGLPTRAGIRVSWKLGGVTHSMEAENVSPDELMAKIPWVQQKWTAAEAEDRKNAGPETT